MTDNEIIKALECCFVRQGCLECRWSEMCVEDSLQSAPQGVLKIALDLINRQREEIERLRKKGEEQSDV